ncbi:MAG: ribbon-helix-helix protein, CopG family [bacterium]|jgi:predicted transcriptional regulator
MPSTTIKLPPELKQRVARLVRGTGQSAHAFMLEAIEQQAALAERRKAFVRDALASRKEALASGKGYQLEDIRRHYAARVKSGRSHKLRAKRWRG